MTGNRRTAVTIEEADVSSLASLAEIPIRYTVTSVFDVAGVQLTERHLATSYEKDYDALGEAPHQWAKHFDVSNWGVLLARHDREVVASAVIAWRTAGLELLEGRDDLAIVWDLRVAPAYRGRGIGSLLFERAEQWAREHDCTQLKVETQNVNVPACNFYAKQGFQLSAVNLHAYPTLPDEVQLLWYKAL